MKSILNNRLVLIAIFLVICFICKSQTLDKKNVKNSIFLKFENYNDDKDCRVCEMLNDMQGIKIVFTCVTAGLLIIESENLAASDLKEKLANKIKLKNEDISFDIIETYSATNTVRNSLN